MRGQGLPVFSTDYITFYMKISLGDMTANIPLYYGKIYPDPVQSIFELGLKRDRGKTPVWKYTSLLLPSIRVEYAPSSPLTDHFSGKE